MNLDAVIVREAAAFAGATTLDARAIPLAGLLASRAERVIVRALDPEPPLETEAALAGGRAADLAGGLEAVMAAVGAQYARVLLSERHPWIADTVRAALDAAGAPSTVVLELLLDRGGIAELIGRSGLRAEALVLSAHEVVVVAEALRGKRMSHRTITLWGELRGPRVLRVPMGASFGDLPAMAGGATVRRWVYVEGGALHGLVRRSAEARVGPGTEGVGVLPADHPLLRRLETPPEHHLKRALSACTNCSACTDVCPPHLMGLDLAPHRIMRLLTRGARAGRERAGAAACIACGLCTARCPAELDPARVVWAMRDSGTESGTSTGTGKGKYISTVPRSYIETRYGITRWRVPEELAADPAPPGRGLAVAAQGQAIGIPRVRPW